MNLQELRGIVELLEQVDQKLRGLHQLDYEDAKKLLYPIKEYVESLLEIREREAARRYSNLKKNRGA